MMTSEESTQQTTEPESSITICPSNFRIMRDSGGNYWLDRLGGDGPGVAMIAEIGGEVRWVLEAGLAAIPAVIDHIGRECRAYLQGQSPAVPLFTELRASIQFRLDMMYQLGELVYQRGAWVSPPSSKDIAVESASEVAEQIIVLVEGAGDAIPQVLRHSIIDRLRYIATLAA